jgi:hypothetical protein
MKITLERKYMRVVRARCISSTYLHYNWVIKYPRNQATKSVGKYPEAGPDFPISAP